MGLQLIESGFQPSLAGSMMFTCKWEYSEGDKPPVTCYSSGLIDSLDALSDMNFWNDMITQVGWWYAGHKRKHGEIACLPT